MYLLRRGALFHFSRKPPDAFQGQNLNLASGPRKVGGNGYLRFVSDLKMEKFTVLSDVRSQTETNQKQ